jgi:hypothetical protein
MAMIMPPGSRFALGTPRPDRPPAARTQAEPEQARVYGQRFLVTAGSVADLAFPAYRYCHQRQLAVTDDAEAAPLIRRLTGWDKTTTGSSDSKDKLQEEWTMDFLR